MLVVVGDNWKEKEGVFVINTIILAMQSGAAYLSGFRLDLALASQADGERCAALWGSAGERWQTQGELLQPLLLQHTHQRDRAEPSENMHGGRSHTQAHGRMEHLIPMQSLRWGISVNGLCCSERSKRAREDIKGGTVMACNCSLASYSRSFRSNNKTFTAGGFLVLQIE